MKKLFITLLSIASFSIAENSSYINKLNFGAELMAGFSEDNIENGIALYGRFEWPFLLGTHPVLFKNMTSVAITNESLSYTYLSGVGNDKHSVLVGFEQSETEYSSHVRAVLGYERNIEEVNGLSIGIRIRDDITPEATTITFHVKKDFFENP